MLATEEHGDSYVSNLVTQLLIRGGDAIPAHGTRDGV